jgi:serine/threonine-protein kinase RsbW
MRANLTTVCNPLAQEEIRSFLNRYFKNLTISDSEKNQVVLAIDEAIANAIEHGSEGDTTKTIQLDLDINEKRILIEITDIGMFDKELREEKLQKDMQEIIKEKQKGGLGLKLIYSIMDIVTFYTKENKSYCMMVKLINKK